MGCPPSRSAIVMQGGLQGAPSSPALVTVLEALGRCGPAGSTEFSGSAVLLCTAVHWSGVLQPGISSSTTRLSESESLPNRLLLLQQTSTAGSYSIGFQPLRALKQNRQTASFVYFEKQAVVRFIIVTVTTQPTTIMKFHHLWIILDKNRFPFYNLFWLNKSSDQQKLFLNKRSFVYSTMLKTLNLLVAHSATQYMSLCVCLCVTLFQFCVPNGF